MVPELSGRKRGKERPSSRRDPLNLQWQVNRCRNDLQTASANRQKRNSYSRRVRDHDRKEEWEKGGEGKVTRLFRADFNASTIGEDELTATQSFIWGPAGPVLKTAAQIRVHHRGGRNDRLIGEEKKRRDREKGRNTPAKFVPGGGKTIPA